jgi:hypothetical protein
LRSAYIGYTVPSVVCKYCRAEFILMAVWRDEDEVQTHVLQQERTRYCPYCGSEDSENEQKEEP